MFGGPVLNPMLSVAAMVLSSVSIVTNTLRLRPFIPAVVDLDSGTEINPSKSENEIKTQISIDGMNCQHRVKSVTETLNGLAGV